jgi:hypothetical protein
LYRYKAFGFVVDSEIEIPEFIESLEEPNVFIRFGDIPDYLESPLFSGTYFQASPNQFLLKVNNIANFYVEGGCSIQIKPVKNSAEEDIRLFLLGSAFGALIHQRGLLPMHGSSLNIDGKAYIFSGVSGAGKSTLAAALVQRGHNLLSDDISVVSVKNNIPFVYAGYPSVKLWTDSVEKLGMDPETLARVRTSFEKRHVSLPQNFYSDELALAGVYILEKGSSEGIHIEQLKGIEKFNLLKDNTYRLYFVKGLGNTEAHFKHIAAVAQCCQVKRITRSSQSFSLNKLLDIVEQDIRSNVAEL